jgi:hypothetical protein
MRKRYRSIRFPEEAKLNFLKKKGVIETLLKEGTGKSKQVTMADTLRFFSQKPTYVYTDEVVNYFLKSKKKRSVPITI